MTNDCIPYYDDGDHITGYCTAAVSGKTFVKISATRTGGTFSSTYDMSTDPARGAPSIATADLGGRIFGVASYDGALGAHVDVVRGSKMVVPVVSGDALSAFDEVGVGPNGTAIKTGADVAVAATATIDPSGVNNALDYTAKTGGAEGNDISITYAAATGPNPAGTVAVSGVDITVYVTAGTTTANQVIGYIQGNTQANALVTVANHSANDGTGTVPAVATTQLAGGAEGGRADTGVGYVLADCAVGADAQVSLY